MFFTEYLLYFQLRYIIDQFMDLRKQQKKILDSDSKLTIGDVTSVNMTQIYVSIKSKEATPPSRYLKVLLSLCSRQRGGRVLDCLLFVVWKTTEHRRLCSVGKTMRVNTQRSIHKCGIVAPFVVVKLF